MTVLQILIEGNVSFFTYIFFRQSFVSFSFNFTDKVFLGLSILIFFLVFLIGICFYFIFNEKYEKKMGYFIYCYYRSFPSLIFITFRHFFRSFFKGVIHSTLHQEYKTQIILLCLVEVSVIALAVWQEKKYKIFMTKSMFCLTVIYHFLYLILILTLYIEEESKKSESAEEYGEVLIGMQTIIIYALVANVFLEFILDFIPREAMKY